MRFMIIVKASRDSEAGQMPSPELIAEMAAYHEKLDKAGILRDALGLQPSAKGWRIRYSDKERTIIDGPFAEAGNLVAGYTLIEVASRQEAFEWSRGYPNPAVDGGEAEIEVRQVFELEDFEPSDGIDRFHEMGFGKAK